MKKRYICEMDEEDVRKIIANHFDVDVEKVELRAHLKIIGCGPMEREEHYVTCKVELKPNQMR